MPYLSVLPNGYTVWHSHGSGNHQREKRGKLMGWTTGASKRNKRFLMSVDHLRLHPFGYAGTMTIRDLPSSAKKWAHLKDIFYKRIRRLEGFQCLHWVTEWQARGHPHIHFAAYFDIQIDPPLIIDHWLSVAQMYRPSRLGQDLRPITNAAGWFQYLAKHLARGAYHYQRQLATIPDSWKDSTGRVWGKIGNWPTKDPEIYDLTTSQFYRIRRLAVRMAISKARRDRARRIYLKRFLSRLSKDDSRQAGFGDWLTADETISLLRAVHL